MFGYVTIEKPELKVKDYYKYQAYYCGLCKVLKEHYGRLGQMTLTYDMTFLIILLSSLYEKESEQSYHRCLAHPAKKHVMLVNEITEYAADLNIVMAYHNFQDDWNDERKVSGAAGSLLLKKKYQKIQKQYQRQCRAVETALAQLAECEKKKETNLDVVSECFGTLMAELFLYKEDHWAAILRETGNYLGRFIYLIDAYEDLEQDQKEGSYNPFVEMSKEPDYEQNCEDILNLLMAECARNFEKLPLEQDVDILRNILYTGVWVKYNKIKDKKLEGKDVKEDDRSI